MLRMSRSGRHAYLAFMTGRKRRALLFLDEGAAFAALEGRGFGQRWKEKAMTLNQEATKNQEHFAPVEAWDAIAGGYDRYVAPGEASFATAALKLAGVKSGTRFLDVAAGTGGLSLPAARLGAKVVATDWSAKMIERFQARVREFGLTGCEGLVMDCHALSFADDTFDVAGSQFGVMLVPDQAAALREMVRVTRPGGRVLLVAYGSPAEFEAVHCFLEALRAVKPDFEGLPSDPPPLEFQVSDPEVMRQRLGAAGLRDVSVETTLRENIEPRSGQELWDWSLGSNPISNMLVSDLTDQQKQAMIAALDDIVRTRSGRKGFALLTAPLNVGIGTKLAR
jgi:ubiquinone/menaquinone biosynthesis C-methylase UbiE